MALTTEGRVLAWGRNVDGQLGLPGEGGGPPPLSRSEPTAVPGLTQVLAVSAGGTSSLALAEGGAVYFWGTLGDGDPSGESAVTSPTPVLVEGVPAMGALASGHSHHLLLTPDGEVWAWGAPGEGGGADGGVLTPAPVPGLAGVVAVCAGAGFSLAVLDDGTVWAWGDGRLGQLGDGGFTSRAAPGPVPGLSGVLRLAAGASFALALRGDGQVWGWGYNRYAELGDGGRRSPPPSPGGAGTDGAPPWEVAPVPVRVTGLEGVTRIAGGGHHGLALSAGGAVLGWGSGRFGQLGLRGDPQADIASRVVGVPTVIAPPQGG